MDGFGRTSGKIDILESDTFHPGEEKLVTITFVTEEILGVEFGVGTTVYFAEGSEVLGEAEIIEVLQLRNGNAARHKLARVTDPKGADDDDVEAQSLN